MDTIAALDLTEGDVVRFADGFATVTDTRLLLNGWLGVKFIGPKGFFERHFDHLNGETVERIPVSDRLPV